MTKRRSHGEGSIDPRGPDTWRSRYRVDGKRYTVTFHGALPDARKELRRLLHDGDTEQHVAPDKLTSAQWATPWIRAGAPGRRKKKVGRRTLERYDELLQHHVIPTLGARPLQKISGADITSLYAGLEGKISPYAALHVHVVLGSCLHAAVRTRKLAVTPLSRAMNIPSRGDEQIGTVLDADELAAQIDLSLVKLPDDALMFPSPPLAGCFSFTKLRCPRAVTREFQDRTEKLGFGRLRLHDLRGTHETLLLDAGVPVHVVAERCGHDPAVLLRNDAKRTRRADDRAAAVIGELSKGSLRG